MGKSFVSIYSNYYGELISQGISFYRVKRKLLNIKSNVLPNNKEMDDKLNKAFNDYLTNLKNQIKITLFVIYNANKLDFNAVNILYNALCLNNENNYNYMFDVFNRFKVSLAKENPSYFYVPSKGVDIINKDNYSNYINIAKGFDIQNVKEFIYDNDIYNKGELRDLLHNTEYVDYGDKQIGIYNDKLVLPKVNDDRSALLAVELLVRCSLLDLEDSIDDKEIVKSRAIPVYYQMLYKKKNKFISCDIRKSRLAYILSCNTKKDDNFDKVIKRVKRIKNS